MMLGAVRTALSAFVAFAACLLITPTTCRAQSEKSPVALRIEPFATSPRSYSPILIEVTLAPRGQQLMEGTLHLRFSEGQMQMLDLRIPDLVVAGTDYTTTLLLPPMPTPNAKVIDVNATFVTDSGVYPLGSPGKNSDESYLSLLVTPAAQRATLIGMVIDVADDPKTAAHTFLNKALALDEYSEQPGYWHTNLRGQPVIKRVTYGWFATSGVIVKADTLPADPLALCAFDVLLIADGGLKKLDQGHMDAMKKWVQAGGSLCVIPDETIERRHTNFLTDLLVEHPSPPAMTLNQRGELVTDWDDMHVQTKLGLGRVVLLDPNRPLRDDFTEDKAKKVAGFLWKVRESQLPEEKWKVPNQGTPLNDIQRLGRVLSRNAYQGGAETATIHTVGSDIVAEQLMPSNVRTVPLWLVSTMLLAYVFIVGPGDYLLLGMLKMRRYTWIVFPIVTALFTAGMVGVSNHYMATTQKGGNIVINDVIGSGQVIRRTGINLDFFGAQQDMREERKSQLITQMDMRAAVHEMNQRQYMNQYAANGPPSIKQPPAFSGDSFGLYYEGRVPGRYATQRTVRQWEPQLSRTFEIVSEAAPDCGFDWDKPGPIWTPAGQAGLSRAIATHDPKVGAILLNRDTVQNLAQLPYPQAITNGPDMTKRKYRIARGDLDYFTLLKQVSNRDRNFFRYVTSISPNGANNFEDLAMLDSSDPKQWLLIVSWLEDDTQIVYRRLYHQPPDPPRPIGPNDPFPEVNMENIR